jgi:hypothetical protein
MPTPDLPQVETQIIQLTNAFRKEQGLAEVKLNAILRKAADEFARYLARTGTFSHTADGREPHDRVKAAGYAYCITSENLAFNYDTRGFETRQLARDAVEGWKSSPGHRKNMVEPNVIEIGVAVAKAPREEKYLSVQLFGRPEALKYQVKVANKSERTVSYILNGRAQTIEPRIIVTHTECTPGRITFDKVKTGFLSSQVLDQRYDLKAGATYTIEPAAGKAIVAVRETANGAPAR